MTTALETHRSAELAARLRRSLPGGDTRTGTFYRPYPVAIERGDGYRIWDVDGNEYIDCLGNFTSLVHGYNAPEIVQAIERQIRSGTAFASPHSLQADVAERLRERVASVEHVRYANSGTEAIILALRAARAFTGRDAIVKAAGGYHGFWEQLPMTLGARGIPQVVTDLVVEHDYNDVESLRAAARSRGDIAAIIIEPVLTASGVIAARPDYLAEARRLADEIGALLIFDEIVTLRLDFEGYQQVIGVRPDLTTFGKIIGGGLPVGAVGGREDVLAVYDPSQPGSITHSGTFNGNALTMAAGCASLDRLTRDEVERINALGARLAEGIRAGLDDVVVTQVGSIAQVHFETGPLIASAGDANMASERLTRFHSAALREGVYLASRGMMVVSTAMDERVVDEAVRRLVAAGEVSRDGAG